MTLPTLLGFDDTVAPGLAQVAGTIANILQPYKQTEIELRNAIQKNPKLAEQLADLEYANPGSTGKIFGPNVQQYATSLAPTAAAKVSKKVNQNLDQALANPDNVNYATQAALGFQPSDVQKESATQQRIKSMEDLMVANPSFRDDRAFQDTLGRTRAAYENEQAEMSATKGSEAFLTGRAAGMSPDQILESALGGNVTGPDGKPFKVSTKEVGDLFQSPTYGKLFSTIFSDRMETRREMLRLKLANAQTQRGFYEDLTKLKVGRALARATEIENANPAAVAAVLYGSDDPSVVALGGVTNPKDPNYGRFQDQITAAKEATRLEGAGKNVARVRAAQTNVLTQQSMLKKVIEGGASDAEVAIQVQNTNTALDEAGQITGNIVQASYVLDPARFFAGTKFDLLRSKGVYYFDGQGNPITEASALAYASGTGEKHIIQPPKAEGAGTAAVGNPKSGTTGGKVSVSTTTHNSAGVGGNAAAVLQAKDIFPNAKPELLAQIDRIASLTDKERKEYHAQILAANPNFTDEQKKQLATLLKVN